MKSLFHVENCNGNRFDFSGNAPAEVGLDLVSGTGNAIVGSLANGGAMTDKEKGSPESVAVRLGAGAKENVFIDYNTEGYDVGVDLKGEGDNGPTGNKFIGGGAKRRQMPEVQAKNDPWYRQIGFQIAAGLAVAAIVGIWTWLW